MKTCDIVVIFLFTTTICSANTAVSELNGKVSTSYGRMESDDGVNFEGSVTFPVKNHSGVQIDGLYTKVGDADFSGVGGHLFWRESEKALLGVTLGTVHGEFVDSSEISIEGEYYFDWITLGAKSGVASIEYDQEVPFIETDKDDLFGQLYIGIYPFEDLLLTATLDHSFDNTYYGVEAEYELPISGVSIFATAMKGDHDYDHALLGVRYYIGKDKSLKSRHRSSDPKNILSGILYGIGNYGAEYYEQAKEFYSQQGSGSGGSSGGSGSYGSTLTVINGYGSYDPRDVITGGLVP